MEEELKQYLEQQFSEVRSYTNKRSEEIETKLLTAFHGWARTTDIKIRAAGTRNTEFEERLSALEGRIAELERKK